MREFYCHSECSKCPAPVPTQVFSHFEKSFTALSIGPYGGLPQITWSASSSSAIVFSFVLSCSKPPTLHPTCDIPLGLDPANLEATDPLWRNLDIWPEASSVVIPIMLRALENGWRYRLGSNGPPIRNGPLRFEWSRGWWRHVTQKGQCHDPNIFGTHYLDNGWRCQ